VSNPAQKQFALGGSGVWHKGRTEADQPTTDFEKHYLSTCFKDDGCEALLRYTGHDVDSYRTELLGVIASLGKPGPVHFGLDNHAAFDDSMAIISKPADETRPRKPWTLVKNGDLLEIVHSVSKTRIANPSRELGGRDIARRNTFHFVKFWNLGS